MKKQFLSVLAFSAILLSSCGGTAKIEKASACGQEGEITASSATASGCFSPSPPPRHCRDRIRKSSRICGKWYLYI